jgi:multidrug efflux pump subunit AcrB
MLALVLIALRRPYTFMVLGVVILILGTIAALKTPTDIFPAIGIPVVSVIWTYVGLSPDDMSGRVVYPYELALTTLVNDIEHIESQNFFGFGITRIYFQPKVKIDLAVAQVSAASQTVLKNLPPGINPPQVMVYNASTVPVIQLALSSKTRTEVELNDTAQNFIRPQLTTIQGAAIPFPYGGKVRQVRVDINQEKLQALGLQPQDIVEAIARQNLILPVGTQKIGEFEYNVLINDAPERIEALNDLPIKRVDGTILYLRDVSYVHNGNPPQINMVRVDGGLAVLMPVQTSGSASTLEVIAGVKKMLPKLRLMLPEGVELTVVGDQSAFISGAVTSVIREGLIAATLTGLMILLFLGSWRSTIIITISIPLSILAALAALAAIGETINVMTLGGLALAVGILVDDATVTIENVNRHLEAGERIDDAIVKAAKEIISPATVSLFCIIIVFAPMLLLGGVAGYLFRPLAEAVVFAMIASYLLTYTLVETMARYFLSAQQRIKEEEEKHGPRPRGKFVTALTNFQIAFEHRFEALVAAYARLLGLALAAPRRFVAGFMAAVALSLCLAPFLGRNFFPDAESNQIRMHVRAPMGTRIEETGALCDRIEAKIREILPPGSLASIVDNIGLPVSGTNMSYNNSGTIGATDADLMITFDPDRFSNSDPMMELLREKLPREFPGVTFAMLPADIVTQILNFGLPAPLDIQAIGVKRDENRAYLERIFERLSRVPGIADPRIQQANNLPTLFVDVDRTLAQEVGLSEKDVTLALQTPLAGSFQSAPNFWLDTRNGVSYPIIAMEPQYWLTDFEALSNLPVSTGNPPQVLGGVATLRRGWSAGIVTHYNAQPSFDIYAGVRDRDLGAVADDVEAILKETRQQAPAASTIVLRGQYATMHGAYTELLIGLALAVLFVYLVIVVNFQSWLDPFLIVCALPTALAGIVWMLFLTGTTLSVPALTGAIMCMGVATANSNLIVAFARERLDAGDEPVHAAAAAGATRFRPVLMTALAMIIGMGPMALSAEQNAPLGRAVIGGLAFATTATLLLLPVLISLAHGYLARRKTQGQAHVAL